MSKHDEFPTISETELTTVAGGFDIGGLATTIGGLVDKFAGTKGKATSIAQSIGGIAQSFMGGGGKGGGGGEGGGE